MKVRMKKYFGVAIVAVMTMLSMSKGYAAIYHYWTTSTEHGGAAAHIKIDTTNFRLEVMYGSGDDSITVKARLHEEWRHFNGSAGSNGQQRIYSLTGYRDTRKGRIYPTGRSTGGASVSNAVLKLNNSGRFKVNLWADWTRGNDGTLYGDWLANIGQPWLVIPTPKPPKPPKPPTPPPGGGGTGVPLPSTLSLMVLSLTALLLRRRLKIKK